MCLQVAIVSVMALGTISMIGLGTFKHSLVWPLTIMILTVFIITRWHSTS
jgi:hypothetical protein